MDCELYVDIDAENEIVLDASDQDEELTVLIDEQEEEVKVYAFDYPPEIEAIQQELAAQMQAIASNAGAIATLNQSVTELDERVGVLEDAYLVKVEVEQDVAFIELSQDKNGRPFDFKEGDKIELIVRLKRNPYGGVFVLLNSNETETNKYAYSTAISFGFPLATATATYNVLNGRVCISLSFNEAVFKSEMNVQYEIGSRTTSMVVGETLNKNMTSVNKITLMAAGSGVIEAGSNVIVKRG